MRDNNIKHNHILTALFLFSVTLFVYKDFGIPSLSGYACLGGFLVFSALQPGTYVRMTDIGKAFSCLAAFEIFAIFSSLVRFGKSNFILYVPALAMCVLCVMIAAPSLKEVDAVTGMWTWAAVLFSLYVIIVKFRPAFYYSFVSGFMTDEANQMTKFILDNGYGVCVGANAVYIDYIVVFAMIMQVNRALIYSERKEVIKSLCFAGFFFITIVLENRKSELLGAFLVVFILLVSRINYRTNRERLRKAVPMTVAAVIMLPVLIYLLYITGGLTRYITFAEKVIYNIATNNNQDISTGRLSMWKIAWGLFKDNPVLGIGWGAFADYVPLSIQSGHESLFEVRNVHNCYLQVLCETGIIGFVIFTGLLFYILYSSIKKSRVLTRMNAERSHRVIMSTCVGYQMFFLMVGFIDPTLYKLIFLCLYTLDLMIVNGIYRVYRQEKPALMYN